MSLRKSKKRCCKKQRKTKRKTLNRKSYKNNRGGMFAVKQLKQPVLNASKQIFSNTGNLVKSVAEDQIKKVPQGKDIFSQSFKHQNIYQDNKQKESVYVKRKYANENERPNININLNDIVN